MPLPNPESNLLLNYVAVKPGLAKKLHVLAALEIERHRKKTLEQATMATLNNT